MRVARSRKTRGCLLLAAALLLSPTAHGGASDDPVIRRLKAERNQADAIWAEGASLVARDAFADLVERMAGETDPDRVKLRASIEARLGTLHRDLGVLEEAQAWWSRGLED